MKINFAKSSFYISFITALFFLSGLAVLLLQILPRFNSLTMKTCRSSGSFCQQSIPFANPLISIPYFFLLMLGFLVISIGLISLFYQLWATLKFKRELLAKKTNPSLKITKLLKKTALENKVFIISDSRIFSFCLGFIYPKIYLSSAVLSKLNLAETEAVLLHEKSHLELRDPLKILISQTIKKAFFFLPVFNDLTNGYVVGKELTADRKAIFFLKNKKTLIKALIKIFLSQSDFSYGGAVAGQISVTRERIEALRGIKKNKKMRFSLFNIFFSLIIVALLFFIGSNINNVSVASGCSCAAEHQCIEPTSNYSHSCKAEENSCLMDAK